MHPNELSDLRSLIAGEIDVIPVAGEASRRISDWRILRRDLALCSRREIEQIELALIRRNRVVDEKLFGVWREIGDRPSPTLDLQHHPRRLRLHRIDDVEIGVLPASPRRCVSEPLAVSRRAR